MVPIPMLLAGAVSAASVDLPCGTPSLLPTLPPLRALEHPPFPPPPGDKEIRNPYGTPNVESSSNFAVHWGDQGEVSLDDVDDLLDSFEFAWDELIGRMEHPTPVGSLTHKFNVYLGDTGDGAPTSSGFGGYYLVDHEGWPLVVVAAATLSEPLLAEHAARHEFYHAIQGSTDKFPYSGISGWYWESTAEWAALELDADSPANGTFVYAYALLPALPVNYFLYPDGSLEGYYQYGAFLFPHYLTSALGWEVVRDTWAVDFGTEDPLEALRAGVADRGGDLDEMWLDHVAHNAVWDYDNGEMFSMIVEINMDLWNEDPVLAELDGAGRSTLDDVTDEAPGRYGSNAIRLRDPDAGTLIAQVFGDEHGSAGTEARFGARVVRYWGDTGEIEYLTVPFDGVDGELVVDGVGDESELWLLVGAWSDDVNLSVWESERFEYAYAFYVEEGEEPPDDTNGPGQLNDDDEDDLTASDPPKEAGGGCGCNSPVSGGLGVGLVGVLLVARRRRPVRACQRQ